jgi:hypothetical protein
MISPSLRDTTEPTDQAAEGPRIFQIGFNRCGTTTLTLFLRGNGISASHWRSGKIARRFDQDMRKGVRPFMHPPRTVAYTDMIYLDDVRCIEVARHFRYIYSHYPDAYYILNTRDREAWVRSRLKSDDTLNRFKAILKTDDASAIIDQWKREWDQHHEDVVEFFSARKDARFTVFDIDKDDAGKLAEFLSPDFPNLDVSHYGHFNRTRRARRRSKPRPAGLWDSIKRRFG